MRITLIGSGNVATHLAAAFKNAGHRIVQVYSRDIQHAALLAYHVNAEPVDNLSSINKETDLFVIAVKDDAIISVASVLAPFQKLMVHTSGTVPLEALIALSPLTGVFYPLQTFSKNKEVDFLTVPVCIEGVDEEITGILKTLAETISNQVYVINSIQRKTLHLAAVFVCNFTNHLYDVARALLEQQGMDFSLLRPLILETAQKVQNSLPATVQTGPAVREDTGTVAAHLHMLDNQPELKNLYTLLSQEIIKNKKAR